jgi:hypothetical protein
MDLDENIIKIKKKKRFFPRTKELSNIYRGKNDKFKIL